MRHHSAAPRLSVPRHWKRSIQAAMINVMSLHYALVTTRSWAASSSNARVRLAAKSDALQTEIALLREEIRIKDAHLARIPAAQRPQCHPTERLAILELRAARGWSLAQTARVFHLTAATIASWTKRLDEEGPAALLRVPVPVNKFAKFVGHLVQRLQAICPRLGKVKIAQMLARAGLHLGATTIGRMRREKPSPPSNAKPQVSERRVSAKYPNHLWHVDLTVVPTNAGFWASWLPFALPQFWPFCWWVTCVLGHYSRRALAIGLFMKQPTSMQIRQFLDGVIESIRTAPKHLVTDAGKQFDCHHFKDWCRRRSIQHRMGAVGKRGSIAVIERFIGSLKRELIAALAIVPLLRRALRREIELYSQWYNSERPHMTLKGATPDEIYLSRRPACRQPRFEPRPDWPRGSPCAKPVVLVKGQPGVRLRLTLDFVGHRRHLPCLTITRAA
jgi:transposase InsO family protein